MNLLNKQTLLILLFLSGLGLSITIQLWPSLLKERWSRRLARLFVLNLPIVLSIILIAQQSGKI